MLSEILKDCEGNDNWSECLEDAPNNEEYKELVAECQGLIDASNDIGEQCVDEAEELVDERFED